MAKQPTRTVRLAPEAAAVSIGRAHVEEASGFLNRDDRDTAVLLTSELLTNAIRHGSGLVHLTVVTVKRSLRIEISDSSVTVPVIRHPGELDLGGRGLQLVAALAGDWGVQERVDGHAGKTVWFTVP